MTKAAQTGQRPIVCVAQDFIRNKLIDDYRLRKSILELPDNRTEHLPGYLPLVPGMPVLLTENIATELGLSNGTRGIFRKLLFDDINEPAPFDSTVFPSNARFISHPRYALVEFPTCKLESVLKNLGTKIIPIAVTEQTFMYDIKDLLAEPMAKAVKAKKCSTRMSIKRRALPLIPAYSITTHKSQGQTLPRIIVDLVPPPGPVEIASIYVPLSRVKRLEDLLITRLFEFSSLQVKPSVGQRGALHGLETIANETKKRFASMR
jgi:hypothetical protein